MVSFEDFKKLDIRVAEVAEAEKVEGSEKLLKLKIAIGEEERQIVAGLSGHYSPEDLVGRKIIVLANLEPKKLMGLESQGMLLAADVDGRPVLLKPDEDVPSGAVIK